MQLKSFRIEGLFGTLDHKIGFPLPSDEGTSPALVILCGRNGIGKTTILRMLDGLMRLDFDTFRAIPFRSCSLEFSPKGLLKVTSRGQGKLEALEVTFDDQTASLHPHRSGPLNDKQAQAVEKIRKAFFKASEDIAFEFIDTERLNQRFPQIDPHADPRVTAVHEFQRRFITYTGGVPNPKARPIRDPESLASRVQGFIREAQVNYRTFFATTEPDLFPRIIERLTAAGQTTYTIPDLRSRLQNIHDKDEKTTRLGLEPDSWDFKQLMTQLIALGKKRQGRAKAQALTVLGTYVEQLESRAAERALVADRLLTFERLMSQFFANKLVAIHPKEGLEIKTPSGVKLNEKQLSSGEYHLLFLMVAALVTRTLGTVIAIDEPEMSMHLAWQRQLVQGLVECASGARPLFIFATHSPDLAVSYPEALLSLD